MVFALVQSGDNNAFATSGSTLTVLPADSTVGNCVVVCVTAAVISMTSSIGTFTKISASGSGGIYALEWWVCLNATGAARTITVTTTGSNCAAQATEWSGGVTRIDTVGPATATSTAPSLAVPNRSGAIVIVAASDATTSFSGLPGTPWTNYDAGYFQSSYVAEVAYQVTSSPNVAAAWTCTSQSWVTFGLVLSIAGPPIWPQQRLISQAVMRAASR